ncbi:hypothetical protein PC123_g10470 [Phytophthora cactorum]|nr:hypothetical protein PC120_g9667 [Phytophthora cactorum]KAG4054435.1 hypothetical protein PC123_g10470 [Phytophthora cactorum]
MLQKDGVPVSSSMLCMKVKDVADEYGIKGLHIGSTAFCAGTSSA